VAPRAPKLSSEIEATPGHRGVELPEELAFNVAVQASADLAAPSAFSNSALYLVPATRIAL
jgi:hypothetical protein